MLTDPPGITIWYTDAKGKVRYRRGTSPVESYHSQYHSSSPASSYSMELFAKRRSSFNHMWNTNAGVLHLGEKDWHTPDTRSLEQLHELCLAHGWEGVPGLRVVQRLSEEERRQLQLSKLPLAAAVALGADIPSTSSSMAAAATCVEEEERGDRKSFPECDCI
jgi:hypothetical protein